MDQVIILIFVTITAYYWYVHFNFWHTLKSEAPNVYRQYSDFSPIKYVGGFHWIDYALRRGYKELKNPQITKAGDALCKAYLGFSSLFGYILLIACLGSSLWIVYFLLTKAT